MRKIVLGFVLALLLTGTVSASNGNTQYVSSHGEVETSHTLDGRVLLADTTTPSSGTPASNSNSNSSSADAKVTEDLKKTLDAVVVVVVMVMKMLYAFMMPILSLIGFFLSNSWVTGSTIGIDGLIEVVWQVVRNIVNIGIVLYLLYLAGANIIPFADQNKVNIKEQLPKVAVALIVVNFSLLFCRTVLSIGNFATSIAFSIPSTVEPLVSTSQSSQFLIWAENYKKGEQFMYCSDGSTVKSDNTCRDGSAPIQAQAADEMYVMECAHKNYYFRFSDPFGPANESQTLVANPRFDATTKTFSPQPNVDRLYIKRTGTSEAELNTLIKDARTGILDALQGKSTDGTIDNKYAYYSDCITNLNQLAFSAQNAMYVYAFNLLRIPSYELAFANVTSITKLGVSIFMSLVLLAMFMLINIALLVAVVVRAFLIWIMMALSPIWVYIEVLNIWNADDEDTQTFIGGFGRFASLALLPAFVGLVLSFGFIVYQFLLAYGAAAQNGGLSYIPLGSMSLYFDSGENIIGGLGSIWGLMFPIIALIALWTAVFAALKFGFRDNKAFKSAIKPIQNFGTQAGKFVGRLPVEHPLIPIPGKGMVSARALADAPGAFIRNQERNLSSKRNDMVTNLIGADPMMNRMSAELNKVEKLPTAQAQFNNIRLQQVMTTGFNHRMLGAEIAASLSKAYDETNGFTRAAHNDVKIHHEGQDRLLLSKGHLNEAMTQNGTQLKALSPRLKLLFDELKKVGYEAMPLADKEELSQFVPFLFAQGSPNKVVYHPGSKSIEFNGKSYTIDGKLLAALKGGTYTLDTTHKKAFKALQAAGANATDIGQALSSSGAAKSTIDYTDATGKLTSGENLAKVIEDLMK